jgi:hypothetical protein
LVKRKGKQYFAWRMPLYPLPAILAIAMWLYIFISTGYTMMLGGITVTLLGIIAYGIKAKRNKEWPFGSASSVTEKFLQNTAEEGNE